MSLLKSHHSRVYTFDSVELNGEKSIQVILITFQLSVTLQIRGKNKGREI